MALFTDASKKYICISLSLFNLILSIFCTRSPMLQVKNKQLPGTSCTLLLLRYPQPSPQQFVYFPWKTHEESKTLMSCLTLCTTFKHLVNLQPLGTIFFIFVVRVGPAAPLKSRDVAWDGRWDGFRAEAGLSLISPLFIPSCVILTLSSWGILHTTEVHISFCQQCFPDFHETYERMLLLSRLSQIKCLAE